jgi:outer membrane protein assembly factor BamB
MAMLVVAVALVTSACDVDWTGRLADPAHSSKTTDSGLTASKVATLKRLWRFRPPACVGGAGGAGFAATPAVFGGVIYIGSNHGCLYAVNESDATVRWSKFTAFQPKTTCSQQLGIVSSVVVRKEAFGPMLYFHSPDGYLYKLLASDGSIIWKSLVQIPSTTVNDVYAWSSPTVVNGKVIIGVSSNCDLPFVQGQVRAYDQTTGALLWVHKMVPDGFVGAGDWYDAAVDGAGDVYVATGSVTSTQDRAHPNTSDGFEQYSLIKIDGDDGGLIWKAPAPAVRTGDPDYASSPILVTGNGVPMVGATNKDGYFRAYRQDDGAEVWRARIGTATPEGIVAALAGGVWDGTHLFIASNGTTIGGTWTQSPAHVWTPVGGTAYPGSVRALDPATGALATVGGRPFEIGLPSNILGPCSMNANRLLVCSGGDHYAAKDDHNNGVFIIDTTRPPAVLRHLEDGKNYSSFPQPVIAHGSIFVGNTDALVKWGQ